MMKARRRMCGSSSLKREFLKKWIKGLQMCGNTKKDASFFDRKNAIQLAADVAIAATRNAATHWRRALLYDVVSRNNRTNEVLVEQILGRRIENPRLIACSRRILRRSHIACRRARRVVPKSSSSIAKKLVKSRTRALQKLVPGGEEMDGVSLLHETLDYIISLRVQIDVMQHVAAAAAARR